MSVTTPAIKALGRNIRLRRKAAGLSIDRLAEYAGISRNSQWLIETGNINTTLETLESIASALGCAMGDLFKPPAQQEGAGQHPIEAALQKGKQSRH